MFKSKKLIATLMIVAMLLTLIPMAAFAAPGTASLSASKIDTDRTTQRANGTSKIRVTVALRDVANELTGVIGDTDALYVWVERATEVVSDGDVLNAVTAGSAPAAGAGIAALKFDDAAVLASGGVIEADISSVISGNITVKAAIAPAAATFQTGVVEANTVRIGSKAVEFTALSASTLVLTNDGPSATADGIDKITFIATLKDGSNNPLSGKTVNFTVNKAEGNLNYATRTTNLLGQAKVELTATKSGSYIVTATSGSQEDVNTVSFNASGTEFAIEKLADVTTKQAVGYTTKNFSVKVTDAFNNRMTTPTVTYEFQSKPAESGLGDSDLASGDVDTNNNSQSSFTPDVAGTYVVRARLANGRQVLFTIEAAEMGKITGLKLSFKENAIARGAKSSAAELDYVDAQGVTRALQGGDLANVRLSSGNLAIASITASSEVQADSTFSTDKYRGDVVITAVDTLRNLTATYTMRIGYTPVKVALTPAAARFDVNNNGTVSIQLVDEVDQAVAFGTDAATRNLDVRVISKPADSYVNISQPSAIDVDNGLERTGKVDFTVNSSKAGDVVLQVIVGNGDATEQFLTGTVTVKFGDVVAEADKGAKSLVLQIGSKVGFQDGVAIDTGDFAPFVKNSTTFVPVRVLADAFKAEAAWDGATNTATITRADIKITLVAGDKNVKVEKDGVTTTIEANEALFINENNRLCAPMRAIADAFGATLDFGPKDGAVEWVSFTQAK